MNKEHNNGGRRIHFNKRISLRPSFAACPGWMGMIRRQTIATQHEYTKHEGRKLEYELENTTLELEETEDMKLEFLIFLIFLI